MSHVHWNVTVASTDAKSAIESRLRVAMLLDRVSVVVAGE